MSSATESYSPLPRARLQVPRRTGIVIVGGPEPRLRHGQRGQGEDAETIRCTAQKFPMKRSQCGLSVRA